MGMFGGTSLDVVPALASIKFLEDVPKRALRAAGKEARWFSVPAGWPLFRAGEMSESIFFVLSPISGLLPLVTGKLYNTCCIVDDTCAAIPKSAVDMPPGAPTVERAGPLLPADATKVMPCL